MRLPDGHFIQIPHGAELRGRQSGRRTPLYCYVSCSNQMWFIFPEKHRFTSLELGVLTFDIIFMAFWNKENSKKWSQRVLIISWIYPEKLYVGMIYLTSQTLCFVTRMQQITLFIYLWCTSSTTFTFIPEYSSSWFTLWEIFLSSNRNGFWKIARWTCGWTSSTTFWFVSRFLNDISKF